MTPAGQNSTSLAECINECLVRNGRLQMLLLGDAGSGKTTLLNHIALNAYTNPDRIGLEGPRIPLILPLREMSQVACSSNLAEWIAAVAMTSRSVVGGLDAFKDPNTAEADFDEMAEKGGAPWLILLDGFDEVPHDRVRDLHRSLRRCVALSRLDWIITSRATATHAGPLTDITQDFSLTSFALSPWSAPELQSFAHCLLANETDAFLRQYNELISGSSAFTPLLALLAICVFKDHRGTLPATKVELYEMFTENAILIARRRSGDAMPAWLRRKEESEPLIRLLEYLALQSLLHPDCTHYDDFSSMLVERIREQYGVAYAPALAQSVDLIQHIGLNSGILVRDQDSIRWWHASMRDFLAGCALSELLNNDQWAFERLWDNAEASEACVFCLVRTSIRHAVRPDKYPDISPLLRRCMDRNFTLQLYYVLAEGAMLSDDLGEYLVGCLVDGAIRMGSRAECETYNVDLARQGRSPVDMLMKLRRYPAALRGLKRIAYAESVLPWMRSEALKTLGG